MYIASSFNLAHSDTKIGLHSAYILYVWVMHFLIHDPLCKQTQNFTIVFILSSQKMQQ